MIVPDQGQLMKVSERSKLPENEQQLHTLLMIEGDLLAGELDVPVTWLETLISKEQAAYIEPGLWIAAEHMEEYHAALGLGDAAAKQRIVRRLLRYRGAQTREQVADRYYWSQDEAAEVLEALREAKSAVEAEGFYFHGELYDRARRETVKMRRSQIETLPPERYAALMANRSILQGQPEEKLGKVLEQFCGQPFPPALWESVLLPARVSQYRPELLDRLLAGGSFFWRFTQDRSISFYRYADIDWDAEPEAGSGLSDEKEKLLYETLKKRGASFMQRLRDLLGGESPQETVMNLAEKGLVYADSFVPVRQWLSRDKIEIGSARQRVNARVLAMTSGRWEVSRPLLSLSDAQLLDRAFDRAVIVCRETISGISWSEALSILRVWEYTGKVRRGYFIRDLSGVQFIRDRDFEKTMLYLKQPEDRIVWLSAADPDQVWGKSLSHLPDKAFVNVPGTAVALRAGFPAAVFERQGRLLRVFEEDTLRDAMTAFVAAFKAHKIFPSLKRITVKQYPDQAAEALVHAGFSREMRDLVLYR